MNYRSPRVSFAPSPFPTGVIPRRLFDRLRISTQSFSSIQTALPEYTETLSIHSFQSKSTQACVAPAFINPPPPEDSDRDSVVSRMPPRYSAGFGMPPNQYEYKNRPSNPWATLKVVSLQSTSQGHQPMIPNLSHKDWVTGVAELRLHSPRTIHRITLSIIGRLVTGALEEGRSDFLHHSVVLWAKEDGDPRNTTIRWDENSKLFDGKLHGSYEMPFSFPFPTWQTQIMPSSPSSVTSFDLNSPTSPSSEKHRSPTTPTFLSEADIPFPPTFQEHGINITIRYELILKITHGRLKSESRIRAPFKYLLATSPSPMSERRRIAYEANSLIPGPLADSNGWVKLLPARVVGQIAPPSWHLPPKKVSMDCILYLANPLAYTRGTVIPCFLTLLSDDGALLDILSSPKSHYIRLVRRVTYRKGFATRSGSLTPTFYCGPFDIEALDSEKATLNQNSSVGGVEEAVKECAVATWWIPPKDVSQGRTVRRLEGEIHLPQDLHPTCPSNHLTIEYSVELLPPVALGFKSDQSTGALASQVVDIVTLPGAGDPTPMPFTEPSPQRRGR